MDEIKLKISNSNKGKNNGNSSQVKAMNIENGNVYEFETLGKCLQFFNIHNKGVVTDRCNHKLKYYFRKKWNFAFWNDDFKNDLYNVLGDLMFEYNQAGKNINKSEFEKAIKWFTEKFYE